jgi:hypothetical protein
MADRMGVDFYDTEVVMTDDDGDKVIVALWDDNVGVIVEEKGHDGAKETVTSAGIYLRADRLGQLIDHLVTLHAALLRKLGS